MPRRAHYPEGAPCWIDRISSRLPEAEAFYSAMFGWRFIDAGGYRTALLADDIVAGFGSAAGPREFWTVYLSTGDIDAAAKRIPDIGGTVAMAPIDAGGNGRLLLAVDPAGTLLGLWSGTRDEGVVLADEPGASTRFALHVPDPAAVAGFYADLFGLRLESDGGRARFTAEGVPVADVVADPEVGAHWLCYFGVTSPLRAVQRAMTRGARVTAQGKDGSVTFLDPWGARFGVCPLN